MPPWTAPMFESGRGVYRSVGTLNRFGCELEPRSIANLSSWICYRDVGSDEKLERETADGAKQMSGKNAGACGAVVWLCARFSSLGSRRSRPNLQCLFLSRSRSFGGDLGGQRS